MTIKQKLNDLRAKILVIAIAMTVVQGMPLVVGSSWALFSGNSANPNNSFATLTVQAPTATSANGQAAGVVQVNWNASPTAAIRAVQYLVFRRPSGVGGYSQITGAPISALTYSDTPASDGLYDYVVETYVAGFTSSYSNVVTGRSDRTAPTTSITCNAGSCAATFSANVTVAISATDTGSGVASVTYSLDGGANVTTAGSSVSFTVSGDANHTVSYFATDNFGNAGSPQSQTVAIQLT